MFADREQEFIEYLEPLEELPLIVTDVSTEGFGTFNWFAVVK